MKTVIIWDELGQNPIRFAVLDGDYRHLNGIYINNSNADEAKHNELSNLVYGEDGQELIKFKKLFPVDAVKQGAFVIVAGFLP